MIKNFVNAIDKAKKIAIFTHFNPDGDALGSAMGLKRFILDNFPEKEVSIYASFSSLDDALSLMVKNEKLNPKFKNFDLGISVDCANLK